MRRMLISVAAMALLATPALVSSAWAQPDDSHRGGRDNAAPQAQDQPQRGQPPQGGGHEHGGGNPAMQAPAAAAPAADHNGHGHRGEPQMAAPQDHGDRGMAHTNTLPPGWTPPAGTPAPQDRGNGQGHRGAAQAFAPAQPAPQDQGNRNNWQGGQNNGRDFNRSDSRPNNYQGNNFGNNRGNSGFGGQRHDFSSFRDFHRSFNAPQRFHAPDYRRPNGWYGHRWSFGEFLPSLFWAPSYWLNDYYRYGLPQPPYGTVWVRDGYDALLIDRNSGEIITVEYDVFY